jgi:arylsulfatase A-like enzyme
MVPLLSFWKVFRLIFLVFSLYLLGDVFYRWDGFSYFASFAKFIPSVALITCLWTTLAIFTSCLIWICYFIFKKLFHFMGIKEIKIEHFLSSIVLAIFSGLIVFTANKVWPSILHPSYIKIILFIVVSTSILNTWLLRNKVCKWLEIIQERITPLVWIFGAWFIISVPIVTYHAWFKQSHNNISQKLTQPVSIDDKRFNIILVTFDALSARNMSVYGYNRPTTPFISKWAKNASLFANVHAESNSTRPTSESLMTGKRVWTHGTYGLENYYDASRKTKIENIGHLLKVNGYYNVALIQNYLASPKRMGMSSSFDEIPHSSKYFTTDSLIGLFEKSIDYLFANKIILHDWMFKNDFLFHRVLYDMLLNDLPSNRTRTESVFNHANKILNKIPKPFFVWIHLYPPHDPYLPPEPYIGMFDASPELRTGKSQGSVLGKIYGKNQSSQNELQQIIQTLRARYDEFIRYCDDQFKNFIQDIENTDFYKDTIIVLSTDHGEIISTTNIGHGRDLDEPETHIPLIIKEPNQTKGQIVNDLIEQIDIPATILDLVGIPIPLWMEGRSTLPLLHGKSILSRPSFSMEAVHNPSKSPIEKGILAIWKGDYKLVHYLITGKSKMFNLKSDPDEMNNLFFIEPEMGQSLISLLQDNLQEANDKIKDK